MEEKDGFVQVELSPPPITKQEFNPPFDIKLESPEFPSSQGKWNPPDIKLDSDDKLVHRIFGQYYLDKFIDPLFPSPPGACQTLKNYITEDGAAGVRNGVDYSTYGQIVANKSVYALHKYYDKTLTSSTMYGFCTSGLYWHNGTAWAACSFDPDITIVSGGIGDYRQVKNRVFFATTSTPVLELKQNTVPEVRKAGLPSPDFTKDICMCEGTTNWSAGSIGALTDVSIYLDTNAMRLTEGDYSLQLQINGNTLTPYDRNFNYNFSSILNLNTFDSGETSYSSDYISFNAFRFKKSLINYLALEFSCAGLSYTNKFSYPIYSEATVVPGKEGTASLSSNGTFKDTSGDFLAYETSLSSGGRTKFKVKISHTNASTGWGFIGDTSNNGTALIYQNPSCTSRGWQGATGTLSDYTIETYKWFEWGKTEGQSALWANNPFDHVSLPFRIRKREFTSSSGDWTDVRALRYIMRPDDEVANATSDIEQMACINVDKIQLLKTPPIPVKLSIQVAHCEGAESWTGTGVTQETTYRTEGIGSIKIKKASTATLTYQSNMDFSYYGTGAVDKKTGVEATDDSEACIDVAGEGGSSTATVILSFKSGVTTIHYDFPYPYKTNPKKTFSAAFNTLRIGRSQFAGFTNAFKWNTVSEITIENNTTKDIWIDNILIEPFKGSKIIHAFDAEHPVSYDVTDDNGDITTHKVWEKEWEISASVTDGAKFSYPNETNEPKLLEGQGFYVELAKKDSAFTINCRRRHSELDLTKFSDTVFIQDSDLLSFILGVNKASRLGDLILQLYYNSGTATVPVLDTNNYWNYTFTQAALSALLGTSDNKVTKTLEFKKSDLAFVGTETYNNFTKVAGFSLTFKNISGDTLKLVFDDFQIRKPGKMVGTYRFKLSFQDGDAYESPSSEQSEEVQCNSADAYVTDMAVSNDTRIESKVLWRMGGGNEVYKQVAVLPNGLQSYYAQIADEDLGRMMEETEYFRPPKARIIEPAHNFMFYGDIIDRWKKVRPSRIMKSRRFNPGQVADTDSVDIHAEDGTRIRGLKYFYNYVTCAKDRSTWLIDPETLNFRNKSESIGCIARRTMATFPNGIIWLSRQGIVIFDASSFDLDIGRRVKSLFDAQTTANLENAVGFYREDYYYIFYGSSNQNGLQLYLPAKDKGWTTIDIQRSGASYGMQSVFIDHGNENQIYFGGTDGYVSRFLTGNFDYGTEIQSELRTFEWDWQIPEHDKYLTDIYTNAKYLANASYVPSIQLNAYKDGVSQNVSGLINLSSSTYDRYKKSIGGAEGSFFSLDVVGSGRYKLANAQVLAKMRPLR